MATQPHRPETIPAFIHEFLDELAELIADTLLEEKSVVEGEPLASARDDQC